MKKILQNVNIGFSSKARAVKAFIALMLVLGMNQAASAQQIGIFESYAILSVNGAANSFYDLAPQNTANPDFQGSALGTFGPSNSLIVRGGQNKTFKNSGGNVTGSNLYYRVWLTSGGATGSFIQLPMSFSFNIGGGGDQQWEGTAGTTNLISSLVSGSYTLEVYTEATGFPGTVFQNNGGNNFRATFVVNNPITVTSTSGTGAPSTAYATLAAAVTAINGGIAHTGTIVCSVPAGNTETAPVGGYAITATGTVSAPITFRKSGAGVNPTLTAPAQTSGNVNDAIFKIIGGDFITIDGFTMLENAANTTTTLALNNMTEWGIALLNASATDGPQNITLRNNTITLNRTYTNTFGIYSNSTHTSTTISTVLTTAVGGEHNNLVITGNTISNINQGIVIIGGAAATAQNTGLVIGGLGIGNSITNYGTAGSASSYNLVSGTLNGILIRNTKSYDISYNTIASANTSTLTTTRGVFVTSFSVAPTGTLVQNISNNNISVRSSNTSGALQGIIVAVTTGNATTTLNINANDFNTSGHAVASSGAITFISNAEAVLTSSISNNTFTNMTVNTTGSVTFLSNSYTTPATGSKNMNNNAIVTAFAKTGVGGTITLFSDNNFSPSGTTINNNNNNFSNITVTGATVIAGWVNTDGTNASMSTKSVNSNTFSNWTGGSSAITALSVNYFGATSSVSNNIISNITGTGNITGLNIGVNGIATTLTIDNNTITNLVSSGTGGLVAGLLCANPSTIVNVTNNKINTLSSTNASTAVNALTISGGSPNVSKNKIYNISASGATATVIGIVMSGGTTFTIDNNYIGDLRATASSGINQIAGISISGGTTANVYFNTVRLNATSSGTNFGTSAIVASTAPTVNLRNNIFVNASTPNGTGLTAAYRRSSATLTSYASTSNNNLFFAGTPSATNLIFTDGTTSDQTLSAFKTRVSTADTNSISENPTFLSTIGTDATFLHIDPTVATGIESGATTISGFTSDYDGDTRNVTTPDIGADEGAFTPLATPVITSLGATAGCQGTSLVVTGTNMTGVTSATIGGTAATVTATTATTATLTIGAGTTGTVTVTSPTGSSTSAASFTVNLTPTTTWAATTSSVCPSASAQTATLAYTATTNSPVSYSITWSPTPTNSFVAVTNQTFAGTTGGGTITINVPAGVVAGTYTGTITNTNSAGCTSVGTQTFTVIVTAAPPTPTTTGLPICTGATIAPGTGLASTSVGTSLTGSQTLNFNVAGQPTETQLIGGNTVASATLTALPAGATITSLVYTYNGITALGASWRSDVRIGLSGALIDPLLVGSGTNNAVNTAGLMNYTRTITSGVTGTPLAGGTVNLQYSDAGDDNVGSAEATFTTGSPAATVVVNYSYPNPTAISWFTAASGGSSIGNGSPFNPVGVAGSGLADTNTAGVYPFYVETSNGTCPSTRVIANLTIGAALTSTATTTASPICAGTSVTIDNTPVGGGAPYTYSWSDGASEVGTSKSVVLSPTTTATYTVTVTDACSQTTTAAVTITVNPLPSLTIVNPAAVCAPATVDITSSAVQTVNTGTITRYYTTNALAIAGAAGNLATPAAITTSGTYFIRSESAAGCFTILPVTVVVNAAAATGTGVTICQGGTGSLTSAFSCSGFVTNNTFAMANVASTGATYSRSVGGTTYSSSIAVTYSTITVKPTTTGSYVINGCGSGDTHMQFYTSPFNPASPATNFLEANDEGNTATCFNNPRITRTLTGGVEYVIVYTAFSAATAVTGITITVTPPAGGAMQTIQSSPVEYYTVATGGTAIGSGASFNPVGVANSGLANTNTPGTTTYYVGCSTNPTCRTAIDFVITATIPTFTQVAPICSGETLAALPTTSNNGVAGTWSPAINSAATTLYTFTPTAGCATSATMTIEVGKSKVWNAGWTPAGAPTSIDAVTISGNYTAATDGGTINACTMIVDSNAAVLINNNANIILQGKLTVTSGSVTINNNSNLLQTSNIANSGNITIKRNSNPLLRLDYTQWSSPVVGAGTLLSFSPATTSNRFYGYNSATNQYNAYATPSTTTFDIAKGYHIRMPNNWVAAPLAPAKYTGAFTGVPNNGPQSITMDNTGAGLGFNLVGNPYPSDMSMTNFVAGNSAAITGTLYFWRKTNNPATTSYSTWTAGTFNQGNATASDPNGVISVGQGFLVEAKSGQTSLAFTNTMRVADNVDHFFRAAASVDYNRIWLNATNTTGAFCQSTVGYMTGATNAAESFDGLFFNDGDINLTSLIGTDKYAIQGRALPFDDNDIVPMSFKATTAGNYTIAIDHVDGLFAGYSEIYLRDNALGTVNNLTTGAYNFASNAGTDNTRFELLYRNTLATATNVLSDNNVFVFKSVNDININSGKIQMDNVKVFDIRGRLLVEKSKVNATTLAIDSSSFANQVLIVTITSIDGVKVSKKIVN